MAYSRTLNHFTSMQELATIWASSTSYVVNQLVIHNNFLYRCAIAHTSSGSFQTDLAAGNWERVSSAENGINWASSTYYVLNQLVVESDKLYKCLVAHTSGGSFITDLQAARWVEISASEAGVFNYIGNPDAEVDASGWTTYAESDSVTFTDAGDLVTLNNHGLSNGNEISFTSITSTTGISVNTRYFVVSATTNTFQVASSSGGSALPLTTNGSGTMVRFVPKTGSGGSPNITWSRSIVSPLRGDADFNLVKDAANRQGQGVEYDFTIDNADLAKVLTVTFDYEVVSGTLATGDVTVYLIQDPSGTPLVIQPAGYQVQGATVGTKMRQIATFQTSSSVTSYRLCLHVSSVSATAYTLAVDNVVVGPQVVQYGAPVTDWQSYTPTTQGFGTVTNMVASYRRVGGNVEVQFYFEAGTPTATEARFGLPTGLTITGLTSVGNSPTAVGYFNTNGPASSSGDIGAVSNNTYVVFNPLNLLRTNANGNGITVAGTGVSAKFSVPILGWSSTVQMSNDTDTRVVAATYYLSANQSTSAQINFDTKLIDTHNAVTTGVGTWKFTAPVPGIYTFSVGVQKDAGTGTIFFYKNNSNLRTAIVYDASFKVATTQIELLAGDFVDIRPNAGTIIIGGSPTAANAAFFNVSRLSGPSAIAASETVAVKARTNAGQALTGSPSAVAFADIEYSTHGSFSGSTFTAPISGKYRVSALVTLSVVTLSISQSLEVLLYKNGTLYNNLNTLYGNGGGANYRTGGSTTVSLLAGETVQIFAQTTIATTIYSGASNAGWPFTYVCIERVGN